MSLYKLIEPHFLSQEVICLIGHAHVVTSVTFMDRNRLISTSHDGTACLWDLTSGHRSGQPASLLSDHTLLL